MSSTFAALTPRWAASKRLFDPGKSHPQYLGLLQLTYLLNQFDSQSDTATSSSRGSLFDQDVVASLDHDPESFPQSTAAPAGPFPNAVPPRAPMATVDSSSKAKGKQVRLEQERQARSTSMTGDAPKPEVDNAYHQAEEGVFEQRERRHQAALILESYERLAWHANTRNEVRQ